MKYPRIIAEIERTQWAITPEALHGIEKAIEVGLTADDYELFHKSEALENFDSEKPTIVDGKGLLVINGPIVPRANTLTKASGLAAIDQLTRHFKALEVDDSVKEICFLVDSPGGAVTGVSDFAQLIKASSKLTSAFVVGQAASAAYWIVSATDKVVASDTSLVGNIGVVLTYRTDGEKRIVSAQSPDKRPDLDSKEGQAILQRQVNEIADVFIEAVAKNRDVSVETVLDHFGKGASVVAKRALSVGMIDEISTINEFMAYKKDDKKVEMFASDTNSAFFEEVAYVTPLVQAQQRQGRSEIQTLIFKKSNFLTKQSAQKWAKDHNFKSSPVVEKEDTWHIRQQDPGKYQTFRTGKPLSPGVTPVYGILKRQGAENKPAQIAGERKAAMKLTEFLAENPAAMADFEAIKAKEFAAGKAEGIAEMKATNEKLCKMYEAEGYPENFKKFVIKAFKGERTFEAIQTLADHHDMNIESQKSAAAKKETEEIPKTPPPAAQTVQSEDGQLKTPADALAWMEAMKNGTPGMEVA